MKRPLALTKLIDTFVRLFPDIDLSRTVVTRAGIPDANIAYDARAAVNWTNIVSEALRQDALEPLVDAAGDLHPELRNDMRSLLSTYQKWATRFASTPELVEDVAAQPAPGLLERARKSILAWSAIAVGCFALIGVLARESRHVFLGLPGSHLADVVHSPRECAVDGAIFVWDTLRSLFDYAFHNPIGCAIVVALIVAGWLQRHRLRRSVRRLWTPAVVIALVVFGAAAKMVWYDAPAFHYDNVLGTRDWSRPDLVDAPPPLTRLAQERWRAVVCSRIEPFQTEKTRKICGSLTAAGYEQDLLGAYALNVMVTLLIGVTAISAIRKLLLPSSRRDWNLNPAMKRVGAAILGAALLLAILPVAWTWSRTVRPTKYPAYRQGGRTFYLCAEKDECYTYRPGRRLKPADKPPAGRVETDDILTRTFLQHLEADDIRPEDRGPRFAPPPIP